MKVGFIDSVHSILEEKLIHKGYDCVDLTSKSKDELLNLIADFEGLVIRSRIPMDYRFLSACKKLKFIARSGAGLENIDLEFVKENNILCFNAPEGNRDAVGEHCVGMLLMLFNKLNSANAEVKNGEWNRENNRGIELGGKTVGIIGYGNNGRAFSEKLSGFNVNILAHDKYKNGFGGASVAEVGIDSIFEKADIISFHVPQNEETLFMFDDEFLKKFKKPIYLINASRGKIVNLKTVGFGLRNNLILGACLDVLEVESKSFENTTLNSKSEILQYIINSKKVVLSPHVAGWTVESYYKLSLVLANKIISTFS